MKVTEFYGNSSTFLGYYKILNVDSCSAGCVGGRLHIFAEKQVLRELSFTIRKKEFVNSIISCHTVILHLQFVSMFLNL